MARSVRYLSPLAVMAGIFAVSARPNADLGGSLPRALGYMAAFVLLWLLCRQAVGRERPLATLAIVLGFAWTDQLHKTLVAGRRGGALGFGLDAAAVLVAAAVADAGPAAVAPAALAAIAGLAVSLMSVSLKLCAIGVVALVALGALSRSERTGRRVLTLCKDDHALAVLPED